MCRSPSPLQHLLQHASVFCNIASNKLCSSLTTTAVLPSPTHTPVDFPIATVAEDPIASPSQLTTINIDSHTLQHLEFEHYESPHPFGIQPQVPGSSFGTIGEADSTFGKTPHSFSSLQILSLSAFSTSDVDSEEVNDLPLSPSPWPLPVTLICHPVGTPTAEDCTLSKVQVVSQQQLVLLPLCKSASNEPRRPLVITLAPVSSKHIYSTATAAPVAAYTAASLPFTGFHSQSLKDLATLNFELTEVTIAQTAPSAPPLASAPLPILSFAFHAAPVAKSLAVSQTQSSFTQCNSSAHSVVDFNFAKVSIAQTAPSAPQLNLAPLPSSSFALPAAPAAESLTASPLQTAVIDFQSSTFTNFDFGEFNISLTTPSEPAQLATNPVDISAAPTTEILVTALHCSEPQSLSFISCTTFNFDSTKSSTSSPPLSAPALLPSLSFAFPVTLVAKNITASLLQSALAESVMHMSDLTEFECYYSPNPLFTQAHQSTSSFVKSVAETLANQPLQTTLAKIVGHTSDLAESECYYSSSTLFQDTNSPSVPKSALAHELDTAASRTDDPLHSFTTLPPLFTAFNTIKKPLFTKPHSKPPDIFTPIFAPHSPPTATRLLSTDLRTLQQSGSIALANDADHLAKDSLPNLSNQFLAKSTKMLSPNLAKCTHHIRSISLPYCLTLSHPLSIIPQFRSPCTNISPLPFSATPKNSCIHHPISLHFMPKFRSPSVPILQL
jgi:hypothetical protein